MHHSVHGAIGTHQVYHHQEGQGLGYKVNYEYFKMSNKK